MRRKEFARLDLDFFKTEWIPFVTSGQAWDRLHVRPVGPKRMICPDFLP